MKAADIKSSIQSVLVVLRPLSRLTFKFKWDDQAVALLEAIEASDELLAMIERFTEGEADPELPESASDEAKILWPKLKPELSKISELVAEVNSPGESIA